MSKLEKITPVKLIKMKSDGRRITALTAYDSLTANMLNEAGIDVMLVGRFSGNDCAGQT